MMRLTAEQVARLAAAEVDEAAYRREMLVQAIIQTTLLKESNKDHREFRTTLRNALILLTGIAVTVGIPIGVVL